MQRAVIVSGTLGLGTALVFGAAAVASALFPNGSTVPMGWNDRGVIFDKGIAVPMPIPVDPVIIDDGKGGSIDDGKGVTEAVPGS
jgi:hypothetical protein